MPLYIALWIMKLLIPMGRAALTYVVMAQLLQSALLLNRDSLKADFLLPTVSDQ